MVILVNNYKTKASPRRQCRIGRI